MGSGIQPSSIPTKVIILGAGFHGLAAAKTYLQINPQIELRIIDNGSSIGGVWATDRIYPGLFYEVPTPMGDFSDFDMCTELGMEMFQDISGEQVNQFLVKYAEKFDLLKYCRLNTTATSITRSNPGWKLTVKPTGDPGAEPEVLTCDKLIVATGINSRPKVPDLELSSYDGLHMHSVALGKRHEELLADDIKSVTIIGGHKSALEAVGHCAAAGKTVNWLVRKDGGGTTWLIMARNPDGSSSAKASTKRVLGIFTPSVYYSSRWITRFFFSDRFWLGSWIMNSFWNKFTSMLLSDHYTKSENAKKLKPNVSSFFWFVPVGTSLHDRDLETLRLINEEKLIHVKRNHIESAQGRSVTLDSGEVLASDAIIYCTGWQTNTTDLFTPELAHELGLPIDPIEEPVSSQKHWQAIDKAAEDTLLDLYPILRRPPGAVKNMRPKLTPHRQYRSIVPLESALQNDRSLIFLGRTITGRVPINAELTSLWGVAYLENMLPASTNYALQSRAVMEKDIATVQAFQKLRYVGYYPFRISIMETPEFMDQLCKDVGVSSQRKAKKVPKGWRGAWGLRGWCLEWFGSYFASDYRGIVDEFLQIAKKS
ncbi:FAD protein [Coleophoma cylindrospora]|uniref:FAD protein n=1 Tax=Coleophoma cylindrospora TaxID=1849047 RepID=A0A3D8RSX4_9HELO|nr:FAD protein [Coleophoma cylindrospora]